MAAAGGACVRLQQVWPARVLGLLHWLQSSLLLQRCMPKASLSSVIMLSPTYLIQPICGSLQLLLSTVGASLL